MYTAGKISTFPDWKITCLVGHVTTKCYVPWDKIYMPRACRHTLMSENPLKTADSWVLVIIVAADVLGVFCSVEYARHSGDLGIVSI